MGNREWWIAIDEGTEEPLSAYSVIRAPGEQYKHKFIHVIEHKAFMELKAEADKLAEALERLFKLMEDGKLVRNIDNDNDPNWAMNQMGFVGDLANASEAITNWQRHLEGKNG